MKLAPVSVPYRVLQKASSLVITVVLIASFGAGAQFGSLGFVGAIGGILVLTLIYEIAYYRRFTYELTDDTFDLQSGVFSRREREIPYGRIQNVDTTRNIVQRLVGISAVNIETAGGGSTEAVIQYVSAAEADRLQQEIRYRKRDVAREDERTRGDRDSEAETDARGDDERPEIDEEVLFKIAPSELALAGILSFDPRVPGLLIALFTGSIPFVSPIIPTTGSTLVFIITVGILLVGAIVLAWVVGALSAIINYWGFQLTRSADELRYERGLLQRYSGTIPFDKIQAMTIEDNPLKRRAGFATLSVETAGYAPGQAGGRGSEAAVPIASLDRVEALAREIDSYGTPSFKRPPKRIRRRYFARYVIALGVLTGILYTASLFVDAAADIPWYLPVAGILVAPIAAHYKWLHRGYWLGEDHIVTRNGFWNRETKFVAYYRIQTVLDTRTIFQRRWNVATVVADTAGSLSILGKDCSAIDIDDADAVSLREKLTERLNDALADRRAARRTNASFQWLDEHDDADLSTPAFERRDPNQSDDSAEQAASDEPANTTDSTEPARPDELEPADTKADAETTDFDDDVDADNGEADTTGTDSIDNTEADHTDGVDDAEADHTDGVDDAEADHTDSVSDTDEPANGTDKN